MKASTATPTAAANFFADDDFVDSLQSTGSSGQYLNPSKLPDGQAVRFRIVSPTAITGWQVWTDEKKCLRFREKPNADRLPANVRRREKGGAPDLKQFMAALVFSYEADTFQIAEFTQKSIMSEIAKYARDEDYGHPSGYDLVLTRTGSGKDGTRYEVSVKPPRAIDPQITARLQDFYCDLNALFDGADPFQAAEDNVPF